MSTASFMSGFDSSIVNLALPAISSSLQLSVPSLVWIPAVYLVVIAILETTLGRIADVRGKKNLLILSLAVFTTGSLIASLSNGLAELIFGRVIQGVGAAGMDAAGTALLTDAFPVERRGRAFGLSQMVVYIGLMTGPLAGGVLVLTLGWRSIFYVNIPIALILMVFGYYVVVKDVFKADVGKKFDIAGAIALTAFLSSLLIVFNKVDLPITSLETYALYAFCIASLIVFVYAEKRSSAPLLDLTLFTQNRLFAGGIATSLMNYLTTYGTFFLISIYLQSVLGYSPISAGITILAQPVTMSISAPLSGIFSERIPARILASIGMALKSGAFLMLAILGAGATVQYIVLALAIIGIGHGMFSSPNVSSVMSSVEHGKYGVASGALGTVRTAGQSMGVAMLGGIVASYLPSGLLISTDQVVSGVIAQDFTSGLTIAFAVASLISTIGVFTSLLRGKENK
jgi:EmrB/QacA subfamily drug resistance transporter